MVKWLSEGTDIFSKIHALVMALTIYNVFVFIEYTALRITNKLTI